MRKRIGSILLSIVLSASMVTPVCAEEAIADTGCIALEEAESNTWETETSDIELQTYSSEEHSEEITVEAASEEKETESTSSEEELELMEAEEATIHFSTTDGMSNDEMFEGYVNQLFGIEDENLQLQGTILGDKLTGNDKLAYDYLIGELSKIAAGEKESAVINITATSIGKKNVWKPSDFGYSSFNSSNINDVYMQIFGFDSDVVMKSLIADYPYELYWFDKTTGMLVEGASFSYNAQSLDVSSSIVKVSFAVTPNYSKSGEEGTYVIDTTKTSKPKAASAYAKQVVAQYASKSDYDKLVAYKEFICSQVEYNQAAIADDWSGGYSDPWQLIYVFDKDPSTNVVCEGYSKAYQYLCDNSEFSNDSIHSIIMVGYMNAEAHMWNIMHMEDGKNYMVDVTNCDGNSIGAPDLLFLVGADSGSPSSAYWFQLGNTNWPYNYDSVYLSYYGTSALTLSTTDYVKPVSKQTPTCIAPSDVKATYGQSLSDITLTNPAGNTPGTWSWDSPTTKVGKPGETNQYKATFTPTDTSTYKAVNNITIPVNVSYLTMTPYIFYNGSKTYCSYFNKKYGKVTITAQNYSFTENLTFSESADGPYMSSYTFEYSGDGEYTKEFYFKNGEGLITDKKEVTIKYDWNSPSINGNGEGILIADKNWTTLRSSISYDKYYKDKAVVKLNATDSYSGLWGFYYYLDKSGSTSGLTKAELDTLKANGQFKFISDGDKGISLSTSGPYVVYAYALDTAENDSEYVCSDGFVVDSDWPIISSVKVTRMDTSAEVEVTATDSTSGVKDFYFVYGPSSVDSVTRVNIVENNFGDGMIQGVYKDSPLKFTELQPDTYYYYAIGVTDKAGNMSALKKGGFRTEKALPEIESILPTLYGQYGTTLNNMTLSPTNATNADGVEGTWSITEAGASNIYPKVAASTEYEITFTPTSSQYSAVKKKVRASVEPKPITIKIKDSSRKYGIDNYPFTYDSTSIGSQLVSSDTVADLNIEYSCQATRDSDVKEGGYPITATYDNANYQVTFELGTLTITKANYPTPAIIKSNIDKAAGCVTYIDLPQLPAGAKFGTIDNSSFASMFEAVIENGKLKLTSLGITSSGQKQFTIPVTGAKNYNDYSYTITITPVDHIHAIDQTSFHAEVPATQTTDGCHAYYECANGCGKKLNEDGIEYTEESLIIPRLDIIITFDANGGSVSTVSKAVKYESAFGDLPLPSREHYSFDGWFTEKNAGNKIISTDTVSFSKDTSLYAHWTGENVTVSFNFAGVESIDIPYGSSFDDMGISLPVPEKKGYTLMGWYIGEGEEAVEFTSNTPVTAALTLNPVWGSEGVYIELDQPSYDYTGKAIKPSVVKVIVDGNELKLGQDYLIGYKNNTKAFDDLEQADDILQKSAPTVVITGKGNYSGVYGQHFKINAKKLTDEDILVADLAAVLATGRDQKPIPVVTWGKTKLVNNRDYTVSYYSDAECENAVTPKDAGTYYVKITAKAGSNYSGERKLDNPLVIGRGKNDASGQQKLVSKLTIKAPKSKTYNGGEEVKLTTEELVVKDGATNTLTEGVEYVAVYNPVSPRDIGTVSVTIMANCDTYVGSKTITYQITGTSLSKAKMTGFVASLPYADGNAVEQAVEFRPVGGAEPLTGKAINEYNAMAAGAEKRAIDYTYEYLNNSDIGKATVIYRGVNNYSGEIKKQFTITGRAMSGVKITDATFVPTFVYDGEAQTQDGLELIYTDKEGNAYPLSWVNAEEYDAIENEASRREYDCKVSYLKNTDAGTATIVLTGVNKYSGTAKKTFKIQQFDIKANEGNKISVSIPKSAYAYDKAGAMPEPEVRFGGNLLVKGKDYTVTWLNNKNLYDGSGSKIPTIKITGKGNFKGINDTLTYTIGKRNLQSDGIRIDAKDKAYTAKAGNWKTSVTVYDGTKKLAQGSDYSKVEYTYKSIPEGAVIKDGSVKGNPVIDRDNGDTVGDKDIVPAFTVIEVKVTGDGKNKNYTEYLTETYVIGQTDINSLRYSPITKRYTGKQIKLATSDFEWYQKVTKLDDVTFTIDASSYNNNIKKGKATVVVKGTGNYCGSRTITFSIRARGLFELF